MGDFLLNLLLVLLLLALLSVIAFLVWRLFFREVTVFEGQTGLRYEHGRLVQQLGPGLYIYPVRTVRISVYDLRPTRLEIPGQEILTQDKAQIKLSLIATYRITDPVLLEKNSASYLDDLYSMIQLTLRDLVAREDLDTILSRRDILAEGLEKELVAEKGMPGLELLSVRVRDIMLSGELKSVYQELLRAKQEAQVSLEKARAESATLRSLANAASLMDKNPSLLNLRFIQAMESSQGNTFVISQDQKN